MSPAHDRLNLGVLRTQLLRLRALCKVSAVESQRGVNGLGQLRPGSLSRRLDRAPAAASADFIAVTTTGSAARVEQIPGAGQSSEKS